MGQRWLGILLVPLACGPTVLGDTDTSTSITSETSTGTPASTSSPDTLGSDGPVTTTAADGTSTSAGESGSTAADSTGPLVCMPVCEYVTECNNGTDDDGDGLVDLEDPDCISPCHEGEEDAWDGIFFGQDNCNVDCFFDDNAGQGDDGCIKLTRCDPFGPNEGWGCVTYPEGAPNCNNLPFPQSDDCLSSCLPMVPPGCDCFGCCTFSTPRGPENRWLGITECTLADPTTCPMCTQDQSCINLCDDPCEWCMGEPGPPPGCTEVTCEQGSPCTTHCDCEEGSACLMGCCRPLAVP